MNSQKSFEKCDVDHIDGLGMIDQAFIDAIYRHNGEEAPSAPAKFRPPSTQAQTVTITGKQLEALVNVLPADMGHDSWKHVSMALSHETGNSEEGYKIFDAWSSRGTKYQGPNETRAVWLSLAGEPENPITIATLAKMVNDEGHDALAIQMKHRERFKKIPFETVDTDFPSKPKPVTERKSTLLTQYSLTGSSAELEKQQQDEVFVLADIALLGQATAIYAAPNCGKTLGVISLLADGIDEGRIKAENVFYVNADDNLRGLFEKVVVAEELGFHMIGEGYRGFLAPMLLPILEKMTDNGSAARSILVIDTAKRFTDLMSKKESSHFTGLVRRFVGKGGTVIALAHVNKQKADSGKSVYAGTSDVIDDFDCAYVVDLVDDGITSGNRVIAFENRKARGSVAALLHFSYLSPNCAGSYRELLDSFCRIDADEAGNAASVAQFKADSPLIDIVTAAINSGPAAKKDLVALLRKEAQVSRNIAARLIEKYCGENPDRHLWRFERGEHGVHRYQLLKNDKEIQS